MHIIAERNKEKLILHLSQNRVELYGWLCFSAMSEAILLYTVMARYGSSTIDNPTDSSFSLYCCFPWLATRFDT